MLENKRVLELHQDLRRQPEQWDGGERGRRASAPGGGGNGGGGSGLARGEGARAFIHGSAGLWVTRG
jgi:hypothetical protein